MEDRMGVTASAEDTRVRDMETVMDMEITTKANRVMGAEAT